MAKDRPRHRLRSDRPDVARYYEENTRAFLARGQGARVGAIHRAVWAEGVGSRDGAFLYVYDRIRALAKRHDARRIVDLGCGTGAGLAYVLDGTEAAGFAITNSESHRRRAVERLAGRAEVSLGDFCVGPLPAGTDVAYGVESFVHAHSAGAFFETVAGSLAPGGRLVLCDDFLAGSSTDPRVLDFQRGWRAPSLLEPERADALAATSGLRLEQDEDWTPLLELDRPRDRWLALLFAAWRPSSGAGERILSLHGGHCLRLCLKAGRVRYRYRIWRKA